MASTGCLVVIGMMAWAAAAVAAEDMTNGARISWLEDPEPAFTAGTSWGVPWPKGTRPVDPEFFLRTDEARVTLWLWSPDAPAMDMRFYEIKQGQDTYEQQLDALNITYEDYEPGFATEVGVARTSELPLWAAGATPARERFADFAETFRFAEAMTRHTGEVDVYHLALIGDALPNEYPEYQ